MASMISSAGFSEKQMSVTKTIAMGLKEMGFSDEEIKKADHVQISVRTNGPLNYWYSGRTPTSSEGHPLYEREKIMIRGANNIRNFKIITDISSNGNAILSVTLAKF